jgi:cytochrome c-type biogenesis protein CcmH/NrfG
MECAVQLGADNAEETLADYLVWQRSDDRAEQVLLDVLTRSPANDRARGMLGRLYFENLGRTDDFVRTLLQADVSDSRSSIALAKLLTERGEFKIACDFLQQRADAGEQWAPLLLGNLLDSQFNDQRRAADAFTRGVELGDVFSATNLGLMLLEHGD